MSRWFVIIGAVLALGFAGVYAWLGGFRSPQVDVLTTQQPVFVAGQYYAGIPGQEFGELFREAGELQRSGRLRGTLGNLYYNAPESEGDSIKAFIGLVVADTSQPLPTGFRYRTFAAGQRVVRARIQAHYMLAPGKLYPALKAAAETQKLKLRQVYLERFPEEGPAEMVAVVK
ncbi:hypothetical protein F0P96_13580 [Hymenobacter busanensis]|uniref:Uncharacterized protein n=1 Tax=Hymenobacter busanensis TaxID=2607656 RepID=A0A7L5A1Y7_9BACT|nr:hypothetical protein [Hymenobacter busanensis]KAA9331280.1 hypothetical protein F0P96_13580 [Hymenobacter busanensis]QHJ08432.1 hypothetical protein GUY19_14505 [Hymenobacter busanensis]